MSPAYHDDFDDTDQPARLWCPRHGWVTFVGPLNSTSNGSNSWRFTSPETTYLHNRLLRAIDDAETGNLVDRGDFSQYADDPDDIPVYIDPAVASLASNAKVIAVGDFSAYTQRITERACRWCIDGTRPSDHECRHCGGTGWVT